MFYGFTVLNLLYCPLYFPVLKAIIYNPVISYPQPLRLSENPCNGFISPFGGYSVNPSIAFFIRCFVGLSRLLIYFAAFLLYSIRICSPLFLFSPLPLF